LALKSQDEPKAVKPKVTSTKKKKSAKAGDIDESEMTAFILGVFGLLAAVLGPTWIVSEDEADQISDPLCRILNKQAKKKKDQINAMVAPMLLVGAIGTIVVPRMMITISDWKEQKNERIREKQRTQSRTNPSETPRNSESDRAESTENDRASSEGFANVENDHHVLPSLPPSLTHITDY
jgi:hypothetical protein